MNASNMMTTDHDRLLYELNRNITRALLPVTVIIGVECVVGLVGNVLIIAVFSLRYEKRTNFRYFVLALAWTDLISCLTTLPGEIVSQTAWYMYQHDWLCRGKSFFNVLTVWSSASVLALLALDRYRKICQPLSWQFSQAHASRMCIACVIVSATLSVPVAWFWGRQDYMYQHDDIRVNVSICEKSNQFSDSDMPLIYIIATFITPVIILLLVTSVLNGLILKALFFKQTEERSPYTIKRTKTTIQAAIIMTSLTRIFSLNCKDSKLATDPTASNERYKDDNSRPAEVTSTDTDDESATDISIHFCIDQPDSVARATSPTAENAEAFERSGHQVKSQERGPNITVDYSNTEGTLHTTHTPTADRRLTPNQRQRRRHKSLIVLVLSAVFVVTTLIYTILTPLIVDPTLALVRNMPPAEKAAYIFFWRLYFVNSAINPVIYGFMDHKFRAGLIRLCRPV